MVVTNLLSNIYDLEFIYYVYYLMISLLIDRDVSVPLQ